MSTILRRKNPHFDKLNKAQRKIFIYNAINRSVAMKGNRTPGYFKYLMRRLYGFEENDLKLIAQIMRKVKKDRAGKYGQGFISKVKRTHKIPGQGFIKKQ